MIDMGFEKEKVVAALRKFDYDQDKALDDILASM